MNRTEDEAPSHSANGRIPVGILGSTGVVGQMFVRLLADHPRFEIVRVMASESSVGSTYEEAVQWAQDSPLPRNVARLPVEPCRPDSAPPVCFSALPAEEARDIERAFAEAGSFVVTNASSHRMDADVPLCVPEVNAQHLELVRAQPFESGAIVANPNCSTIGLVMALAPLARSFGLARVHVVTLQALSGAGQAGVPSLAIVDNVLPYIAGEEEKIETETLKILGRFEGGRIDPARFAVSAACNRVAVRDGHLARVHVELERAASLEALIEAWRTFRGEPQLLGLPSAPSHPVHYLEAEDAPQPRLHRDLEGGMAVSVGRLRPSGPRGFHFAVLSHNTVRGAAGGAILLAELALEKGVVRAERPERPPRASVPRTRSSG